MRSTSVRTLFREKGPQLPVVPFKFCRDCHGLVCNAFANTSGVCSGGGPHNLMDIEYFLPINSSGGDDGWFLCAKCCSMFSPEGTGNKCGKGGKHEAKSAWPEMSVAPIGYGKGEMGWSRCSACSVLNWNKGADAACPAGGKHDNAGSTKYVVDNRVVEKT